MKDDNISRAAALKELENLNIASFYELNEHSKEAYTEVKAMLKALPSAQPGEDIRAMCGECDAWNQYKNYPPRLRSSWLLLRFLRLGKGLNEHRRL